MAFSLKSLLESLPKNDTMDIREQATEPPSPSSKHRLTSWEIECERLANLQEKKTEQIDASNIRPPIHSLQTLPKLEKKETPKEQKKMNNFMAFLDALEKEETAEQQPYESHSIIDRTRKGDSRKDMTITEQNTQYNAARPSSDDINSVETPTIKNANTDVKKETRFLVKENVIEHDDATPQADPMNGIVEDDYEEEEEDDDPDGPWFAGADPQLYKCQDDDEDNDDILLPDHSDDEDESEEEEIEIEVVGKSHEVKPKPKPKPVISDIVEHDFCAEEEEEDDALMMKEIAVEHQIRRQQVLEEMEANKTYSLAEAEAIETSSSARQFNNPDDFVRQLGRQRLDAMRAEAAQADMLSSMKGMNIQSEKEHQSKVRFSDSTKPEQSEPPKRVSLFKASRLAAHNSAN